VGSDLAEAQGIVAAGVLHAAIGMMDQVLQRAAARSDGCEFRRNPATDSDLKPATVPI
jgi:hypothetical protein